MTVNILEDGYKASSLEYSETYESKDSGKIFNNQIDGEWLSTKLAASYLKITPNALRIMVCRGKIVAYRLGNRLRFKLIDLRNLLCRI
ncbi:MAG: hypothetical protein A2485_12355 [Bdellovibrionales bacterium RIFOXYC12_FULL_39_17]|nr:MAG: hypothetical protein A2485_12355 [Bdellovibrionales bacterium RIFOXYC12_FULL_39_17]HLE12968.1 helix-turn-helix domain-containing protein [Bacteriovoracaceae bacterium]